MLFFVKILFSIFFAILGAQFSYSQSDSSLAAFSKTAVNINFSDLNKKHLKEVDSQEFINLFIESFGEMYKDFTLEALGKTGYKTKEDWLRETAEEEVQSAVAQQNTDQYVFFYKGEMIAYLAYKSEDNKKSIYIAQFCVKPKFWRQYILREITNNVLPKNVERYTLLVRVLNVGAIKAYEKLGFIKDTGDSLAKKYGYPSEHYLGMHKILKEPSSSQP